MATFKFGRAIDLHWNGYDIQGPAETVFSIPDQLYEEFDADIAPVEPTLVWIDTNEFQTLENEVSTSTLSASLPIALTTTTSGKTISLSSTTALNGYLLAADGTGGTIWTPASTSSLTSVIGVSPISTVISGGTVSVSLNASYQTAGSYQPAGTYVTGVVGTSPISASGTTAITVSIDSSVLTAENAARMRTYVRNTTASTITKGSVVYLDGSNGTVPSIKNALADTDATSARTFGIVEADILTNSNGYVTNQGLLSPLNTSGVADGAVLWLSPTVAGAFTTTKPAGPNHGVLVGIVVKGTSVGAGSIYVLIKNGAELDEIHDVNITSLANGQALIYSSSASVWQNQELPVSAVIGTSPASVSTASGTSTVSIVAGSINSTHLSATSVGSSQLIAQAVGTAKISSGAATSGQLLQADGLGAAVFATVASGATVSVSEFTATGTWTKPAGAKAVYVMLLGAGGSGGNGARAISTGSATPTGPAGGGAKVEGIFNASVLDATVTVTIGAGGTSIAGSTSTTTTAATAGIDGGVTYFGTSSLYYLFAGGGVGSQSNGNSNTISRNAVARWNATQSNANAVSDFERGASGKDMNSMGASGGISLAVTSDAISSSNLTAENRMGYAGFGITAGITRTTTNATPGANGQSATSGWGTSGSAGQPNNTVSGLNSGNGGNGGNGFRGGGGGSGGGVWAASGTSRVTGSGGAGGEGYAVVISW